MCFLCLRSLGRVLRLNIPPWKSSCCCSKIFETIVNNRLEVGNVVFCLQWGFTYSHSTADLLTAVDDRIVKAFNNSSATGAVPCDISQVFDSAWHVGLLYRINSHRISHQSSGTLFGSLLEIFSKIMLLKLEFLLFSYHRTIFLLMLSLIFLCFLMLLLSNLIRIIICENSLRWLLNLRSSQPEVFLEKVFWKYAANS